jgi:hypothetical protein
MATRDELYQALRNADAAGDVEGARKLAAYIQSMPATSSVQAQSSPLSGDNSKYASDVGDAGSRVKSLAKGALVGVADIGNTVLNGALYLPGKLSPELAQWNRTRNADMDYITQSNNGDNAFKLGRIGGNIAATYPVGGAIADTVKTVAPGVIQASPTAAKVVESIASGGFRTGAPAATTTLGKAGDLAIRSAGGAITGGASAGLVNPSDAGAGTIIGAALPPAVMAAGKAGNALASAADASSKKLMQSAIKPTINQLKTGDAQTAVNTLLQYGINPNSAGVNKLRSIIDGLNDQIASKISSSGATVSKQKVLNSLADVRQQFANQVSPTADINAIQSVADDFAAHPALPSDQIPVQTAQDLKQGTYRVLAKKYGQMGGAETEAQKGLARGLKDEIANAVPDVAGLNAEESKLIKTLGVTERRALMELNKNPVGLAALAQNPLSFAAFMADKSALFKSLAARMISSSTNGIRASGPMLENAMSNPLLRNAATATVESTRGSQR